MIDVQDIITSVQYGLYIGALSSGICILTGLFWRVLHILN